MAGVGFAYELEVDAGGAPGDGDAELMAVSRVGRRGHIGGGKGARGGGKSGGGGRIGRSRRVVRASVGNDGLAGSLGEFSYGVMGGGLAVLATRGQGRRGHHQTPGEHGCEDSSQQTSFRIRLHILLLLSVSTAPPALGYAKRCRSVSILWPSVHLRPPHRKKKPPSQEERSARHGWGGSLTIYSSAPTTSSPGVPRCERTASRVPPRHGGARSLDVPRAAPPAAPRAAPPAAPSPSILHPLAAVLGLGWGNCGRHWPRLARCGINNAHCAKSRADILSRSRKWACPAVFCC